MQGHWQRGRVAVKKLFLVPQEGRAPLKIFTLNWEECQLQSDLGFVSNDEIVEAP